MLAGWFSSIVYVNIIYTLTVSFGDIGKAVSVVLLVMQVAGSGGTFPIEVAPAFFKAVYPLLPFVHSMAALRETIGGMYGMTYWTELGKLGIFLILSLILGLLLRKPVIRMNEAFAEKTGRDEDHVKRKYREVATGNFSCILWYIRNTGSDSFSVCVN